MPITVLVIHTGLDDRKGRSKATTRRPSFETELPVLSVCLDR
jgi:hypothetical protein